MEKFKTNGLIIFVVWFIMLLGCTNDSSNIAPYSDLYVKSNPQVEEIDYQVAKPLKYINIHCTASKGELTKEWLLNFFKNERKWSKPGYNLVVHMDGVIDTLVAYNTDGFVSYDEISYGVRGKNSESINVAYTGGVDTQMKPKDTRTDAQKLALNYIVTKLRCQFPDAIVMGHRDHNVPKACPSFDVSKEYYKPEVSNSSLFDTVEESLDK